MQVILDGLLDLLGAADHAGGGAAQLDEVLAHGRAVEHRVEGRHLVHTNGRNINYFGHLLHNHMNISAEQNQKIMSMFVPCPSQRETTDPFLGAEPSPEAVLWRLVYSFPGIGQ